jgi:hypothetical protein
LTRIKRTETGEESGTLDPPVSVRRESAFLKGGLLTGLIRMKKPMSKKEKLKDKREQKIE